MAVERLGKIIVEWDGKGFLVMFPDGTVRAFMEARRVERAALKWFKAHTSTASIGEIEWPAGHEPKGEN